MDFDPYYHWLGIPPREQPPNHYRLLGIELFEPNDDVISFAADRQMAHLRSFQNSKQSADSQRLLNEVSAARVCLLSPERRAAYDAELRSRLAERSAAAHSHPSQLVPPDHTPPHAYGPPHVGPFPTASFEPALAHFQAPVELPPTSALPTNPTAAFAEQAYANSWADSQALLSPANASPANASPATQPPAPAAPTLETPQAVAQNTELSNASSVESAAIPAAQAAPTGGTPPPANRPIPRPVPQPSSTAGGSQPLVVSNSSRSARRRPKNAGVELAKIVAGGAFGCVVALGILWFGFDVDPVGWHDHVDPKMLDDVSRKLGRQQLARSRGASSGDRGTRGRTGGSGEGGSGGTGSAGGADDQSTADPGINAKDGQGDRGSSEPNASDIPGVGKAEGSSSGGNGADSSGGMSKFPTAKGRSPVGEGNGSAGTNSAGSTTDGSARHPPNAGGFGSGTGAGILARGTVPLPSMEARQAALRLLDESYKVDAAKTAADKKAVAEKLLAASQEGSVSDAERFALWQRTASLAADAGEAKLVQTAIEGMARTFDYDASNAMEKMLVRAMDNIKDEASLDACIPVTQKTIFEFIVRDEVDAAMRLTDATYTLCLKAFGKKHRKFVFDGQALIRRLDQQWQRAREAREAIASGAGTPIHQRELGRYLCVSNSQWDQGLPHLIQGDNEAYAAAARLDLENPADNAARIAVADRWYDIAMANPTDEGFAARAIHWYSQAVGDASGLAKTKAMTRLDELRRVLDELDKRELCAARILRSQLRR
jgi:hypothetical protein